MPVKTRTVRSMVAAVWQQLRSLPRIMTVPVLTLAGIDLLLGLLCLLLPTFGLIGAIYSFNTVVVPVVLGFVAAACFLVWKRFPCDKRVVWLSFAYVAVAGLLAGGRILMTHIEPHWLKLQKVTIQTSKVSRPIRILHISDIQSAAVGRYERKTFARMAELAPDLILFTGDLLQPVAPATADSELPKLAALFQALHPAYGVWGVYGDVDERLRAMSSTALGGVKFLEDGAVAIDVGADRIRLYGLSRERSRDGHGARAAVHRWLQQAPDAVSLVLGHAPDYALSLQDLPVDLCLAGHTHGGQIRLPWIGPLVTLTQVPRDWARGFREIGKTRLNVSAGVGCEHMDGLPSIRFNCRPEMTLIELVPAVGGT